jgi:Domain of unknown function (DUF4436)
MQAMEQEPDFADRRPVTTLPGHHRQEEASTTVGRSRVVLFLGIGVLFVLAYVASVVAYRSAMDEPFVPPEPPADAVSVVLRPTAVDGQKQLIVAELLVFPGSDLTQAAALRQDIQVTVSPTIEGGTVVFPAGSVPSPQQIALPAPGVIEKYPFDAYELQSSVKVATGDTSAGTPDLTPVEAQYSVFFNTPGWSFDPTTEAAGYGLKDRGGGIVKRSPPTVIIGVIFILLILAFGLMAAGIEVAVLRGRYRPEISTASWLTAALFALISLRNGLPGSPPLGSWMDILVYFWVIAGVMLITVATVSLILRRSAAAIREEDAERAALLPSAPADPSPAPGP